MPELPEVETVCRGLATALKGKRIAQFEQHRDDLRLPLPMGLAARLKGRRILDVTRRGKYILMALEKNETLLMHLGMSGRMVITHKQTKTGKHDHIVFTINDGAQVFFQRSAPLRHARSGSQHRHTTT